MASLTWKIPQIGSQRVGIFLSKCKKGEAHELTNGGKVVLTHIVVNDRATPIKSMSLATLTTKLSGSYKFLDKDENVYGLIYDLLEVFCEFRFVPWLLGHIFVR